MISMAAAGLPVCAPRQRGERVKECGANPCDHVTGSVQPPFHSTSTAAVPAFARNDSTRRFLICPLLRAPAALRAFARNDIRLPRDRIDHALDERTQRIYVVTADPTGPHERLDLVQQRAELA